MEEKVNQPCVVSVSSWWCYIYTRAGQWRIWTLISPHLYLSPHPAQTRLKHFQMRWASLVLSTGLENLVSLLFNFKMNLCYWVIIIQLFKLTIEHLYIGPPSILDFATQLLQQAIVLCAFDIASIRNFVLLNVCCADRISTLDWKLKIFSTFIIYGSRNNSCIFKLVCLFQLRKPSPSLSASTGLQCSSMHKKVTFI